MALNMLDLNDDCLLEIFKNLTDFELADIASTCSRFKTIACDLFSLRHHKSNGLEIDIRLGDHNTDDKPTHRRQTAAILREFGELLSKLKITFGNTDRAAPHNTIILNVIAKYCTKPLQQLELKYCNYLQPNENINARNLFRNVKELILDNSSAIESSVLSDAKQLCRLTLIWLPATLAVKFLSIDYPQLQSLTLHMHNQQLERNKVNIIYFLKRHPNVTEVELLGEYDLSFISYCCPSLKKLTIWGGDNRKISPITKLDKLTAFKLSTGYRGRSPIDILMTLKSSQSLEELVLQGHFNSVAVELMAGVGRFVNLKHLSIEFFGIVDEQLLAVFQRLKDLRVLKVGGCKLQSITSSGLVDLVKHLRHLEQLSFHSRCCPQSGYMQLVKTTYLRICELYRRRKQMLVIRNYDADATSYEIKGFGAAINEPFAEYDKCESVRLIAMYSLDHHGEDFFI